MSEATDSANNTPSTNPRPWLKPWKPGQTGNPAGAPKAALEARALARSHAPLAIQTLVDCCRSKKAPWAARTAAAQALLNRAFGMPKQELDVNTKLTLEALVLRSLGEPEAEPVTIDATEEPTDVA